MSATKARKAKSNGETVRAVDLVPAAFADTGAEAAGFDSLEYDLGHLAAFDSATLSVGEVGPHGPLREAALKKEATARAQLLVNKIWALPMDKSHAGPMAQLPAPMLKCPRSLPLPKPKAPTKWELYAKEKGIKKRKRERMIWDEEMKEFRPRYGYNRANDEMRDYVIEVGKNDDPYADPFEERANKKKQRVINNKLSHIRNLERAAKEGPAAGIPAMLKNEGRLHGTTLKKTKQRGPRGHSRTAESKQPAALKAAKLAMAQLSTASLGKFDKVLAGEPSRPMDDRKKIRRAVEETSEERSVNASVLRRVLGGSASGRYTGSGSGAGAGAGAGSRRKGGRRR